MKKTLRILLILSIFALLVMLTNSVLAAYVEVKEEGDVFIGYDGSNVVVTKGEDGVYNLELTGDAKQDLIIRDGENVVLDLKGHTFENFTLACETIKIQAGGTLTLKDSVGTGTLTVQDGSAYAVIENNGTLIIENGTVVQKAWSAVLNNGTARINNGKFEQEATSTWSLIDNKGTLTINNGDFDEGEKYYLIRNENTLTINGGDFNTQSPDTSLIANYIAPEDKTDETKINMKITNGTFYAPAITINNYEGHDLEISGGTITSEEFYAVNNWGNCTVTGGTLTSNNNSAVRVVYSEGEDKPSMNIGENVTIESAAGNENIAISNDSTNVNMGTATDKDGNTVVGEVEVVVEPVACKVGETITPNVTVKVGGVEVVADELKMLSSDENILKVNADNTLTAVAEGTTSLTVTYGEVSTQVAVNVTSSTVVEPEDPTTDPTNPEKPATNPEEPTDEEEVTNPDEEEIVQTGDYIYIAIVAVVLIVVANVIYVAKKRSRK